MRTFERVKRYRKPLVEIDQKINRLEEAMRTSGLYSITGYDQGVPEVPAIPAVDPTYEDVTGGLSNPDDFAWGDQGDGSDPDAAVVIPDNLYTTYNGEQVAAARYIEGTYPDGVIPLGYVIRDGWLSTNSVGYLSAGGFTAVASVGVYANASTDLGRAYQQAYYNWPFPGKISKTIYLWTPLDCLFGSCKGASQYYPSDLSATSTPKADRALYAHTLWIPADADGNVLPNRFMTDPGSAEVPAIPAIPPRPIVVRQDNLGDPTYYSGPVQVAGLTPLQAEALIDIVRNSPPGPTRTNAINQLYQGLPGAKNQKILNNLIPGLLRGV